MVWFFGGDSLLLCFHRDNTEMGNSDRLLIMSKSLTYAWIICRSFVMLSIYRSEYFSLSLIRHTYTFLPYHMAFLSSKSFPFVLKEKRNKYKFTQCNKTHRRSVWNSRKWTSKCDIGTRKFLVSRKRLMVARIWPQYEWQKNCSQQLYTVCRMCFRKGKWKDIIFNSLLNELICYTEDTQTTHIHTDLGHKKVGT